MVCKGCSLNHQQLMRTHCSSKNENLCRYGRPPPTPQGSGDTGACLSVETTDLDSGMPLNFPTSRGKSWSEERNPRCHADSSWPNVGEWFNNPARSWIFSSLAGNSLLSCRYFLSSFSHYFSPTRHKIVPAWASQITISSSKPIKGL